MAKSFVSVVKVQSLEADEIMAKARKAIEDVGGMRSFVREGDLVFIKPNFVAPIPSNTGVTTNLAIVEEVINEVKDLGGRPVLGEGLARREFDPETTLKVLGIEDFSRKVGVEFVDLENAERVTVGVPGGVLFKKLKLPKIITESDIMISLPTMKIHRLTTVTLGMKNLWGILPMVERLKGHSHNLDQGIVDINKAVTQDLVLVDGTIAVETDGLHGNPVKMGVLVAGKDVMAVDTVCCRIMGIDPETVKHLGLAFEQMGGPRETEVIGEPIEDIKRSFTKPPNQMSIQNIVLQTTYMVDHIVSEIIGKPASILPFVLRFAAKQPRVDRRICTGCGACSDVCPVGAIEVKSVAWINHAKCVRCRCLLCTGSCPVNAINSSFTLSVPW